MRLWRRLRWKLRGLATWASFSHVHGPRRVHLADDQVALILVGRDAGYFLADHIAHHLGLGVHHVVYVDNGSTDDSIEIVKKFPRVTIVRTPSNFRYREIWIRYFAITRYVRGGWRLAIDPDEIFDFPGSDHLRLPDLVRLLAARGQSAVVAQMLEMVPPGDLDAAQQGRFADAIRRFNRYDLRNITRLPYHGSGLRWSNFLDDNKVTNPEIPVMFGGLRNRVFGENCCLTKHALFRMQPGVRPMRHPHVSTGLTCADFSAVLKHYKFAGDVVRRESKLLAENRVAHGEAALRMAKMQNGTAVDLGSATLESDPDIEKLVDQGFLQISEAARAALSLRQTPR